MFIRLLFPILFVSFLSCSKPTEPKKTEFEKAQEQRGERIAEKAKAPVEKAEEVVDQYNKDLKERGDRYRNVE